MEVSVSSLTQFKAMVNDVVAHFPDNNMCKLLDEGKFQMKDYHGILLMIFHQTFNGPSTFALAAGQCDPKFWKARDYLIHHSEEEKSHWQWVIGDLKNTGYTGKDPRELFPRTACQAYLAFNVFTALKNPLGRLAIATVLESIGATYGKKYATQLCASLKLDPKTQAVFFFGHGDTDVGHTEDLFKILEECELAEDDWEKMINCARVGGELYRSMYNEAVS
jgi:hypothetical protein